MAELADLRDPALLTETVASALGLRDGSTRWLVSSLADFMESKHLLLVLDNCEHLLDACAVLADSLLRACPDLKILSTSRGPLGVGGETVLEVSPLPLPDDDRVSSPEALVQYDAIRLFVERARSAWPQFEVTPSNAAEVSALCRHLDGAEGTNHDTLLIIRRPSLPSASEDLVDEAVEGYCTEHLFARLDDD